MDTNNASRVTRFCGSSPLEYATKSRLPYSVRYGQRMQVQGREKELEGVCLPFDELLSYFKHACASILCLLQDSSGDWRRPFRVFVSALTMSQRVALSQYIVTRQ